MLNSIFLLFSYVLLISLLDVTSKTTGDLTVLFSITSGASNSLYRNILRNTWLSPCNQNNLCDFRFFVDTNSQNASASLMEEKNQYKDIVLRDTCSLMEAHPGDANYGNTGWDKNPVKRQQMREYKDRRRYKIDWKVCFMKWAVKHNKVATYHVYVEDDFIVCMHNLLHQLSLLEKLRSSGVSIPSFRMGFVHNDHRFDDSSTIMTSDIVKAFALHYPSPLLSCDQTLSSRDQKTQRLTHFLSWGPSWLHCDWRTPLRDNFNISVVYPHPCTEKLRRQGVCPGISLIEHFQHTGHERQLQMKDKGLLEDFCRRTLLLDVVKRPITMSHVWNGTKGLKDFFDFSPTFFHEGTEGWQKALQINRHYLRNITTL